MSTLTYTVIILVAASMGACVGFFAAALCVASRDAEDAAWRQAHPPRPEALDEAWREHTEQMAREAEAQPQYYQQQPRREVA